MGILCELYYANKGNNKLLKITKNILKKYNLPITIDKGDFEKKRQILITSIYKNIFLDKKKISRYPRYIFMKKIHKSKIKELQDSDLILQTINNFI